VIVCFVVLISSKGLIEKNIKCIELEQLFSGIITTAIISQWMKNNMKWKESIALLVVNIEYSLPNVWTTIILQVPIKFFNKIVKISLYFVLEFYIF
jgi:hypothetical protein